MKKLAITLAILTMLSSVNAHATGSSKPKPPKSNGLISQTEQGQGTSIFDYFRRFFG